MSAASVNKRANTTGNQRSVDNLDELAALARMITYAKYSARDVELVDAMHWLDLALRAVTREIGDAAIAGLLDVTPSADAIKLQNH